MDELVKIVAQKANISPDQAKVAVTAVVDFLKTKLPAPIAAQLDAVLKGDLAGGLGGLLGKK